MNSLYRYLHSDIDNDYEYEEELCVDMDSDDETIDAYIEKRRDEFNSEWWVYVDQYND